MGESLTVFRSRLRDDGERVTLVTFETAGREAAWRDDVEHRAAQREGASDPATRGPRSAPDRF